jgi:hypothetical protein
MYVESKNLEKATSLAKNYRATDKERPVKTPRNEYSAERKRSPAKKPAPAA